MRTEGLKSTPCTIGTCSSANAARTVRTKSPFVVLRLSKGALAISPAEVSRLGSVWPPKENRSWRQSTPMADCRGPAGSFQIGPEAVRRSEEHTSELQSLTNLVCRLL